MNSVCDPRIIEEFLSFRNLVTTDMRDNFTRLLEMGRVF